MCYLWCVISSLQLLKGGENMWNFKWTFSKNIVSVTMIGIVTILPAMSVQADGLNPEQFLELKQAKELAYQGKDLDFLANEIMQLDHMAWVRNISITKYICTVEI